MVSKIHHVGIVVEKLDHAYTFWRDTLGLPLLREAEIPDQGVRAALLAAGDSEVELLEPIRSDNGVARFLARRGEGRRYSRQLLHTRYRRQNHRPPRRAAD